MLENLTPPKRVFTCAVRTVLQGLDEKDKKILVDAIANVDVWPAKTLSRALKERNIIVSDTAIGNHRKGGCSC